MIKREADQKKSTENETVPKKATESADTNGDAKVYYPSCLVLCY